MKRRNLLASETAFPRPEPQNEKKRAGGSQRINCERVDVSAESQRQQSQPRYFMKNDGEKK